MYMTGALFMAFLIVATVCITILAIVKMALRHAENMKRITHGYPTRDGAGRVREDETYRYDSVNRQQ